MSHGNPEASWETNLSFQTLWFKHLEESGLLEKED